MEPCARATSASHCHSHASPLRLTNALAYSCNTWFLSTFLRMMGDRDRYETKDSAITVWNRYMRSMGLGGPTGIDMEGEKGGLLANAHYLNRRYDGRWNARTVMWIAMGAGRRHRHAPPALCPGFLHRQPWLVVPSPSPRLRPPTIRSPRATPRPISPRPPLPPMPPSSGACARPSSTVR